MICMSFNLQRKKVHDKASTLYEHCSSKSHDSEGKYYPHSTLRTDSESLMQHNTKGSEFDQESLKKTSRRLATVLHPRRHYASTKPSKQVVHPSQVLALSPL